MQVVNLYPRLIYEGMSKDQEVDNDIEELNTVLTSFKKGKSPLTVSFGVFCG